MALPLGSPESPETATSFKKSLQASRSVDKDSRLPNRFYPRFQEASRKYFRLFVVGGFSRSSISDISLYLGQTAPKKM